MKMIKARKSLYKVTTTYGDLLWKVSHKISDHAHNVRKNSLQKRIGLVELQRALTLEQISKRHGEDTAKKLAKATQEAAEKIVHNNN